MKRSPIRILFVSHESNIGGSTVSLLSLIEGLKEKRDLEIMVMLPDASGNVERLLTEKSINFKKVLYRRNFKFLSEKYSSKYIRWDVFNIIAVFKIVLYIKKEKIDLICSNSTGVDVGARAARMAKVPHIYYVREFMYLDHKCEYRNEKQMKFLLENSQHLVFISKAIEKYYISKYKISDSTFFFDGFLVGDYLVESHHILQDKDILIIQVGTFSDGKGTMDTIELLHYMNQNGIKNWKMEFVGNGSKEYIEKMQEKITNYHIEEQVTISDFCLDIKEKLARKDILIMNSVSEGFGRVTVEGMLAGCLVIGRNLGGTREIIDNNVNGIIFDTKEEFLDAITKINNQKEKYRSLAESGQKYAVKAFDYRNTAKNFYNVVESCMTK